MDVSGTTRLVGDYRVSDIGKNQEPKMVDEERHEHRQHRPESHPGIGRRGRALGIFKQELQMRLSASFEARFGKVQEAYLQHQNTATPDSIIAETVGSATQIAAESPAHAEGALISLRTIVSETASFVRETLGQDQDYSDLDNAVADTDGALAELEAAASNNVESSASVLAVDTSSKERSTIRIQTQEGDIVKFSLKSMDKLSATQSTESDAGFTGSVTEIEISSRSKLKLHIQGDINESELSAIQNVFAQAEKIANEFFDGDIGEAFKLASAFQMDSEQLAAVNIRFRSNETTRISYAGIETSTPVEVANETATETPEATAIPVEQTPSPANDVLAPPSIESSLSGFFDTLRVFLGSVGEGFEAGSINYHYSESFKLDFLRAVVHTVAPQESEPAAQTAGALIEAVEIEPFEA